MSIDKIKQQTYLQQNDLKQVVSDALTKAQQQVDEVEIAVNKSTGISVSTLAGETENIEFNSDGALAITVYQNQRKGSASTNDLSTKAIDETINRALAILQYTSADPCSGLGEPEHQAFVAPDLDLFYPSELNVEQAVMQAKLAEQTALAYPQISRSDGASFQTGYGIRVYGNSHGMLQSYAASQHSLSCVVIGESQQQMERDYYYTSARDINELLSPEVVGRMAAERTIASLGARQLETMQVPVLLSPEIAVGFIGHLASAISGSAVYRKSTFLLDKIGQPLFPDWLDIVELPHIIKGIGSSPFDSEGTLTYQQSIISEGRLQTYLLNNYSARKLGLSSTGHAGGIHNWRLLNKQKNNQSTFADMVKQLHRGVVITSLMGQGVNYVTGDYSRGASGFWVEQGEIQYPINEITIAGNLKEMFAQIVNIGADSETRTNIQCGSLLIERMSIAGK